MKTILMSELKEGDIFTNEMKIKNREAFQVIEKELHSVIVVSRNDGSMKPKQIKKSIKGKVIVLRNAKTGEIYV